MTNYARWWVSILILLLFVSTPPLSANGRRSERSYIKGGVLVPADTTRRNMVDSLGIDSLLRDSLLVDSLSRDSLVRDSLSIAPPPARPDSLSSRLMGNIEAQRQLLHQKGGEEKVRQPFFSDSMSLSRVCWTATVLPGFGQIYNKQYWKLPILYSTITAGAILYATETKRYKPLKEEFDDLLTANLYRTDEINSVQADMIRSNTRRQIYLGATIASYIYFLGDAAVNYSSNETSHVKRATTLATICPGAGQIYNKQYWKVPFVVGGTAALIYVIDWNNRGYQRFKRAYSLIIDYENNPELYPNGSPDEFSGRYSASYMQSLRDSYRRNRDLSIIMMAGLYILQIIDAHVDAHFKDFDVSDDLSLQIEPSIGYTYSPTKGSDATTYGFNIAVKF